jgi:DNA-directed RNA polymerase subunit RPC12/RpoP
MERKEKFECPHCKKKLPFFFVTKIKADHVFDCLYCGEKIIPESSKSFTWGYVIGFLSFVLPAQFLHYLNHNFLVSFLAALLFGLVSVFLVASYVYTTTDLIKST